MTYQEALSDYYQARFDEILSNYNLALEKDVDGVHDMRVSLKRMKAFFNIIGAIDDGFDPKKRFRSFKKIAKKSGNLRDVQVQIELITDVNKTLGLDVSAYYDYLGRQETESHEMFRAFAESSPLDNLKNAKKTIEKALEDISRVRAETKVQGRFFNIRNNLVIAGREKTLAEETLHRIRILSKEIHYTFEILNQCFNLYNERTDFVKAIKKVHQVLGSWHDYEVGLEHLDCFFAATGITSSQEPYTAIIKHMRTEKRKLHRKFGSTVKRFCDTAITL